MRLLSLVVLMFFTLSPTAHAEGRAWIGTGRFFSNDYLGDSGDRWRTGSFSYSHLRGRTTGDGLANGFGDVLEYRLRTEIITPAGGSAFPGDRPYVGALSLGLNAHFTSGDLIFVLGGEVTAIGPQTGLSDFQRKFHDTFGMPLSPFINRQLDDEILFTVTQEVRRIYQVSDNVSFRPFAAAQVGVEDMVRLGGDFRFSGYGQSDIALRDVVTGQLYRGTQDDGTGWEFQFGGDVAFVADSAFLPADRVAGIEEVRTRLRAGVGYTFARGRSVFYGLTYLSPEFVGQPEGQVLGSLRLNFTF